MDIQEAIEYLEPLTHHPTLTGSYADALKSAVVALREQAERENGCSLCNGERLIFPRWSQRWNACKMKTSA